MAATHSTPLCICLSTAFDISAYTLLHGLGHSNANHKRGEIFLVKRLQKMLLGQVLQPNARIAITVEWPSYSCACALPVLIWIVASDAVSLCIQTKGAEVQIADSLLKSVLGQLLQPDANMADHVEGALPNAGGLRLQGKLRLCAALIRVLKRYSVGAPSGGGLVEKLLTGVCGPLHRSAVTLSLSAPYRCVEMRKSDATSLFRPAVKMAEELISPR